jgi:hypothetical protein
MDRSAHFDALSKVTCSSSAPLTWTELRPFLANLNGKRLLLLSWHGANLKLMPPEYEDRIAEVRTESEQQHTKSQELREWAAEIYRKSLETRVQNQVSFRKRPTPTAKAS